MKFEKTRDWEVLGQIYRLVLIKRRKALCFVICRKPQDLLNVVIFLFIYLRWAAALTL